MQNKSGDLIAALPERFLGEGAPVDSRFRLRIGRITRDVVVHRGECHIEKSNGHKPDVEIKMDEATWAEIDAGRLSGIEAFGQRRLIVRGSIENALRFEPLFGRPFAGGLRYSIEEVKTKRARFSTLVAGDPLAEPLVLIHGLGATKASWLTVVPELAKHFRVMAVDLPGFGASSKPLGRYDASWFTGHMFDFFDALGVDDAIVAGNSMGGRIAQEMALTSPDRIRAIACLCPATAFTNRPFLFFARIARAELGVAVARLPRERLRSMLKQMFADPTRIDPEWYDAAIDDFRYVWRNPRARIAFFAAARRIYLEEGVGEEGFWARLSTMQVPALYIYGEKDTLITHHFARKVRKSLPAAKVQVWPDCGHTPQLEWPDRTASTLLNFYEPHIASQAAS